MFGAGSGIETRWAPATSAGFEMGVRSALVDPFGDDAQALISPAAAALQINLVFDMLGSSLSKF